MEPIQFNESITFKDPKYKSFIIIFTNRSNENIEL